jgi:hypothetical protein
MTTSLYVTGTNVASVDARPPPGRPGPAPRAVTSAHAVDRPVVDGLASSVCGALVNAIADMDWHDMGPVSPVRGVPANRRVNRNPTTSG